MRMSVIGTIQLPLGKSGTLGHQVLALTPQKAAAKPMVTDSPEGTEKGHP